MITFELVSKKRKPIKRYAFGGIISGFLILILVGYTGRWLNDTVSVALMILVACIFVASLYIINYSVKFKDVIGQISFFENYIEVISDRGKEIIYIDNIHSIRFKIAGYEGLNSTTFFEYLLWFPSYFSYKNGMNNFVSIVTSTGTQQLEFYIPNKITWLNIKKLAQHYNIILSKIR